MGSRIYALWPTRDKGEAPNKRRITRFAQPPLHRSFDCWIGTTAGGDTSARRGPLRCIPLTAVRFGSVCLWNLDAERIHDE